jgi:prepilin-type N-terminal cleavage/methylation domain-containing protein
MTQRTTDDRSGMVTGSRGFTMIEMVMVLVLIGLLAGFAIPRLNVARMKSDGAARLVRMLIMNAQRTSITRQSNTIVSFDLVNSRIRIVEDYNNNDTLNTGDRVYWRAVEEGVKFLTPPMVRVVGGTATSALQGSDLRTVSSYLSITFRRDGSASSDAEIYFSARANVPTEFRAMTIAPSTGRTDLYRWTGTAWVRYTQ